MIRRKKINKECLLLLEYQKYLKKKTEKEPKNHEKEVITQSLPQTNNTALEDNLQFDPQLEEDEFEVEESLSGKYITAKQFYAFQLQYREGILFFFKYLKIGLVVRL